MNSVKSAAAGCLLLAALAVSHSALADRGGHHHHHGHHGARVGLYIGAPLAFGFSSYGYPGYAAGYGGYGGYGYYAPTTVITVPAAPTVYIEQGSANANQNGPASDGNWYYCRNPDGYYPYVRQCAERWQQVPAQPTAR